MPSVATTSGDASDLALKSPTTSSINAARRASLKILNRNVDKVVLGNLIFDTWYYSPYPDSIVLGLDPNHHSSVAVKLEARNGQHSIGEGDERTRSSGPPACAMLHVCPYCFRYTPSMTDYVLHANHHISSESQASNAGEEIRPVPDSATRVYEWEGYTVWDVDGEVEKLYCQNLSLFGKLFLEQKSVFFDTAGFHYFVLTYKPPTTETSAPLKNTTQKARGRQGGSSNASRVDSMSSFQYQVLGFFSKENLSWDSNNLACILVFPPFQHRNLGQLLMAVSYKLSGWEWEDSIIGGPEKPLSVMGRKSYLRFWSERIARFIMGQTADADGRQVFGGSCRRKKTLVNWRKEEMTVKEIGDRTGMLAEDVAAALVEMGVCEQAMPSRLKKQQQQQQQLSAGTDQHEVTDTEDHVPTTMTVCRSRILAWAEQRGVDMISPVREEGFLGEWALSDMEYSGNDNDGSSNEGTSEENG